jgi:toxin secretion/phage lysis holin
MGCTTQIKIFYEGEKIMKHFLLAAISVVGSAIAGWFGGWTTGITTLVIFMATDYITGLLVAGVFHASPKTEGGTLESKAGWKGLIRKGCTLLMVLIACRLDLLLGVNYIRDAVVIAFILNETLSIIENIGLMGINVPEPLAEAVELLKNKNK